MFQKFLAHERAPKCFDMHEFKEKVNEIENQNEICSDLYGCIQIYFEHDSNFNRFEQLSVTPILTHFSSVSHFTPPENVRKPFSDVFKRYRNVRLD